MRDLETLILGLKAELRVKETSKGYAGMWNVYEDPSKDQELDAFTTKLDACTALVTGCVAFIFNDI